MTIELFCGNNLDILPTIPSQSVDAAIMDPPYPHIKRDYGTWTTEEWWALIVDGVIPEVRRILKPTGSAVFILQPNSEHVGQMRGWLWEFMAWVCREWNMVQDAWWWRFTGPPNVAASIHGLMRQSVKPLVWCGPANCYRDQKAVLWKASYRTAAERDYRRITRDETFTYPGGQRVNYQSCLSAHIKNGGVTPFNLLPFPNNGNENAHGHGAGTPLKLADWWVRYICPPGGTVLDPFDGVGTMMLAALQNGCNGIGIERDAGYHKIAQKRIDEAQAEMVQARLAV